MRTFARLNKSAEHVGSSLEESETGLTPDTVILRDSKGGSKYYVFESAVEAEKYVKSVMNSKPELHVWVLEWQPRKIWVDIDMDVAKLQAVPVPEEVPEDCKSDTASFYVVDAIRKAVAQVLAEYEYKADGEVKFMESICNRPGKFSTHLRLNVSLANRAEHKHFLGRVKEQAGELFGRFIDAQAVNGLRLPNCYKGPHQMVWMGADRRSFTDGLTSYVGDCVALAPVLQSGESPAVVEYGDIAGEDSARVIELCMAHPAIAGVFKVGRVTGAGTLSLERIIAGFCDICKRDHEKAGWFVTVKRNVIKARCHRDQSRPMKALEIGLLRTLAEIVDAEAPQDNVVIDQGPLVVSPPVVPQAVPVVEMPPRKGFDFADPYDFGAFRRETIGQEFASLEELNSHMNLKGRKTLAYVTHGEGMFAKRNGDDVEVVKKLGLNDLELKYKATFRKTIKDRSGKTFEVEDSKRASIKLCDWMKTDIYAYDRIVCRLDESKVGVNECNIWRGFQAKLVPTARVGSEGFRLMVSFIQEVWSSNDAVYERYITSWLSGLVRGKSINKTAVVMISPQGCGKNTLTDFLRFVLGGRNILNAVGVASIAQKHNMAIQGKRLVVVNEMSSTKEEFKSNFDKIKAYVTDDVVTVEPKGINSYEIDNIGNYIMFSNHRDAICVEEGDRRYAVFQMNSIHKDDEEYFARIRALCFNQEVADEFYTYLMNYDAVSLFKIPETAVKKEAQVLSRPNPIKFLMEVADGQIDDFKAGEVSGMVLYDAYKSWCSRAGERHTVSQTKFGTVIGEHIIKRKAHGKAMYDLGSIKF